ncbi:hypothetical protein Tco_1280355, partial [Tanacetum coccineum]
MGKWEKMTVAKNYKCTPILPKARGCGAAKLKGKGDSLMEDHTTIHGKRGFERNEFHSAFKSR